MPIATIQDNALTELQRAQRNLSKSTPSITSYVNKVTEGDCLDVMKNFPDKSVDMILCDLPYGTTQNEWDCEIPLDELWNHYERVIKENGVIALTAQGVFTAKLILSNPREPLKN